MRPIVIDTCTLINFAIVDQVPLLKKVLGRRGRWTEAVHWETKKAIPKYPGLRAVLDDGFLGEPIEFTSVRDALRIDELRLALSAPADPPLANLGEAQSIYAIHTLADLAGATFLTDDGAAADYARQQNIRASLTMHFLADAFAASHVGCPEAYEILQKMADLNRGVYVPASHYDVCP